ncbi:MAG: hypothetical protein LBQ66_09160 [Planctomycetaceae bacterium]|jgi:hypothetical protein|nr:hypothetical protein [Planctomycetaceae bacterium]
MKRISFFCVTIIALCFVSGGCSDRQQLGGRVTYTDGQPLEAGTVCFEKADFFSRGEIGKDGKYTVGSYGVKDGIPIGTYTVYVTGMEVDGLVTKKYLSGQTSGLTFTVDGKNNVFDFSVERITAEELKPQQMPGM